MITNARSVVVSALTKRTTFFPTFFTANHFIHSSTNPPPEDPLVEAAVTILKHNRSKTRWTHLRKLLTPPQTTTLTPNQVSEIALQLRNKPHLALRFFNFTLQHSLCSHTLISYATIIHILSRSRLKAQQAQSLIQSAIFKFPHHNDPQNQPPPIFQALVETYRACDSAPFVFDLLIKACLNSKRLDFAILIVRLLMSKSVFPRIDTVNSLIELVIKREGCSVGYDMYKEFCSGNGIKGIVANATTFNIIMVGYYREGLVQKVEEVWSEMRREICEPITYSYSILMAAYCEVGKMEDAMRVWEEMEKKGVKRDIVSYNTIIGGFCRVGEVLRAEELLREMVLIGLDSTCATFELLIGGHCKNGNADLAMLLYEDMCRKGFRPGSKTVDAVVEVLCEKSRVSEALDVLRGTIKKYDVVPRKGSYELLIKGLCLEGRMNDALKLQAELVAKGYAADSKIYSVFIDGYLKHGDRQMAEKLRKEMTSILIPDGECK